MLDFPLRRATMVVDEVDVRGQNVSKGNWPRSSSYMWTQVPKWYINWKPASEYMWKPVSALDFIWKPPLSFMLKPACFQFHHLLETGVHYFVDAGFRNTTASGTDVDKILHAGYQNNFNLEILVQKYCTPVPKIF